MVKTTRRSQAEIVAALIGADINDVRDMIYQPTVYVTTRVFCVGDGYCCAPLAGHKPPEPEHFQWEACGEAYGRTVYASTPANMPF